MLVVQRRLARLQRADARATRGAGLMIYFTGAVRTILRTSVLAGALVLLHATFRSPNLKARLSSVNEEFRAVWRGYNEL
jgi:hypothetical protein